MVRDASKDAFVREFIEKMPEKYNYVVGIKGS